MVVTLQALAGSWPDALLQELTQLNVMHGALAVPCAECEGPIKQGKLQFFWNQIRGWIVPPIPAELASPHGEQKIELPLAVFVPLFIAQGKIQRGGRQTVVPDSIPDLFAGPALVPSPPAAAAAPPAPTPAAPLSHGPIGGRLPLSAAATPQPVSTAEPEPSVTVPATPVLSDQAPDINEVFAQPGKRHWTPAEIVQKTATLPGVAGALIAMQDGLMVANQLPGDLNGEMIAAFLPQMFGRMSHYTAELKLGEPSSLLIMVNQAPLHISRVGRVFYTVLGKAGQPLPGAAIAAVIVQLDRQAKQL
jgi:predicted regulator of Ras-like GTPase activity (Roadblock/LC7/MglB family)